MTIGMRSRSAAVGGFAWIAAGTIYLVCEAVAASRFPGYSYATNFISDLGVPELGVIQGRALDSPLALLMNVGFLCQGILFVLGAVLVTRLGTGASRLWFAALAAVHAVGIVLVGLVPGSPSNASNGLMAIHVGGAGLAIIGGNLAVIVAGFAAASVKAPAWLRVCSIAVGVVGIVSLIALVITGPTSVAPGVLERASVYSLIVWEIIAGISILRRVRDGQRPASSYTPAHADPQDGAQS